MPPATPYTFTHGDLTSVNIMVENGNLIGIIDWEASGYYPSTILPCGRLLIINAIYLGPRATRWE